MADSRELVLCDVLCFLVNKFVSTGVKQLKSILVDFYSSDVLNEAKVRLLDDIESLNNPVKPPHVPRRREGDNKITREADDLITLLMFLDENKLLSSLPRYVCASPDSMPSTRLFEGDLNVLLVMLEKMDGRLEEYRSTLAAIVHDVGELRSKVAAIDQFPALQAPTGAPVPTWVQPRQSQPASQLQPRQSSESLQAHGIPTHTSIDNSTSVVNRQSAVAAQSADAALLLDAGAPSCTWATSMSTPNRYGVLSTDDERAGHDEPFVPVLSRRVKRARQQSSPAAAATNKRVQRPPPAAAQRQVQSQRRTFMYGKSSAAGANISAAQIIPRKVIFCIDNLSRSCSVNDIKSFVSSLSVEVLSCFEVKPRRRRGEDEGDAANRKAFRLAINADHRDRLLDESAWPNSVLISDWYFKPPADRQGDDKRKQVVPQSNIPLHSQPTSVSGGESRSTNLGSVVAEIHVDNEDTIVVTHMESQSDEDGDGDHGQHGSSFNQ